MIDSYGRKIEYARLSITDLCNFRCGYCMPQEGIKKKCHNEILTFEEIYNVAKILKKIGITKIRLTGGEPLVRKGIINLLSNLKSLNFKTIAITTNGFLACEMADEISQYVDNVNISLDSLNREKFKQITNVDGLDKVLLAIDKFSKNQKCLKLNSVLLGGVNDNEIEAMAQFAKEKNLKARFIELMPFSHKCNMQSHFVSSEEIIKRYDMKFAYKENTASYYNFNGLTIGFISPITNKFCQECNRIRITADGKLMPCLHQNLEFNLKPYLNDEEKLEQYIADCIAQKPKQHSLCAGIMQKRNMSEIGG